MTPGAIVGTDVDGASGAPLTPPRNRTQFPPGRILLLALLGLWSLLPLALLVVVSMSGGWRFPSLLGASPGVASWASLPLGRLAQAALTSLTLAMATGGVAAGIGLPLGRALARLTGWRRALGAACAFLPVATPPLLVGIGLQYSLLRIGVSGSWTGVLLAHLVPAAGYTALFFLAVFTSWNFEIEGAARQLGATPLQTLRRVTLPLLRRPLVEAFLLGFLVSWAQVPLTLLIGQGRVRSLTVEVLSLISAGQDPVAAAGAILLVLPPIALMVAIGWAVREVEVVVA